MTRRTALPALALALIAMLPSAVPAAPAAADGVHDVGELMAAAETWVDLETMDAVVLLESRSIELRPGGRTTTFHEIVWISTELGIERYADLRVPHDTATSTLEVVALRTWMDGRWWPHESELNPTAIVETIPYAVQAADDYTNMRETMLLHDGVEIPCIMETIYRITERRPADVADDGLWIFPGDDPAVRVVYSVTAPPDAPFSFDSANGAPDPIVGEASGGRFTTRTWAMRNVDRLPRPLTADPASHQPHVVWSTWENWGALGDRLSANLDGTLALSDELADTLAKRLEHVPTLEAKADEVAAFIRETTRFVNYDDRFWRFAPRPSSRTWDTAYGHRLDRAVLATALFQEAGCVTDLLFRAAEGAVVDAAVPGLSRFEGVSLRVRGDRADGFTAFFDPSNGSLTHGLAPLARRTVWSHIGSGEPHEGYGPEGFENGELRLELTIEPGDEGGWTGTCFFDARGTLSPHASLVGLGDESSSYLGRLVSSVLEGADVTEHNFAALDPAHVLGRATFGIDAPEEDDLDDLGRTVLEIGDPAGGAVASLPSDVHLYQERRESQVRPRSAVRQTVSLRLKKGESEVVRLPGDVEIRNDVGVFSLTATEDDDWIEIERTLEIRAENVPPDQWPALRALLLAEESARNRTIILK